VIGEQRGREPKKDRRRRGLLLLLLLLIPFALGGLTVEWLHGGSSASVQGTPSVSPDKSSAPSPSGTQAVGGVEATPIPRPSVVPSAVGSGEDVAQAGGAGFTISGGVGNLMPGVVTAIPLTLTNPNGVPIFVTALTVTIAADSTPAGCSSANNVQLTQSNASSADPITVPARGSVTLTSAPRAPKITLLNLPGVNQDVCKNKSFALTYSGSASS
jgi:septal ring-binding cell division protein DamX